MRATVGGSSGHSPATPRMPSVPNSRSVPTTVVIPSSTIARSSGAADVHGHAHGAWWHDTQLRVADAHIDVLRERRGTAGQNNRGSHQVDRSPEAAFRTFHGDG